MSQRRRVFIRNSAVGTQEMCTAVRTQTWSLQTRPYVNARNLTIILCNGGPTSKRQFGFLLWLYGDAMPKTLCSFYENHWLVIDGFPAQIIIVMQSFGSFFLISLVKLLKQSVDCLVKSDASSLMWHQLNGTARVSKFNISGYTLSLYTCSIGCVLPRIYMLLYISVFMITINEKIRCIWGLCVTFIRQHGQENDVTFIHHLCWISV